MKVISDNYIQDAHFVESFSGTTDDAFGNLSKYTNEKLSCVKIFVYGLLRKDGAPMGEGFNALLAIRNQGIKGPIAVTWAKAYSGSNIEIIEGAVRKMRFAPGESAIAQPGNPLEVFTVVGSKEDVMKFLRDWDNVESNYDRIVCDLKYLPSNKME